MAATCRSGWRRCRRWSPPSPTTPTTTPAKWRRWRAARDCGSRTTCATRRSITRCASTRSPRCRRCWWSAARKPPTAPSRSAASARKASRCCRSTLLSPRSPPRPCRPTCSGSSRRRNRQQGTNLAVYDAFISYSHAKDKPIAAALQTVVQRLGKPWYQRRALRIFRDDTSLTATPHLWPSIEQALGDSRFLIFMASPEAAASPWVGKEIDYWLEHKSADTLLIALTDGALAWDNTSNDFIWSAATPLPTVLKGRFGSEPKWVDLS